MCDPVSAIAVTTAAISAYGAVSEGRAQAAALNRQAATQEANAGIARSNAQTAVLAAQAEADRVDRARKIQMSQATAGYGKSGVQINDGTPIEVLGDTAAEFELERLFQVHKGKVIEKDQNYRADLMTWHAGNLKSSANAAQSAGMTKAVVIMGASLLSAGIGQIGADPTLAFGASQSQLAKQGYDVSTFAGFNALGATAPSGAATGYNVTAATSSYGMGYE